MNHLKQFARQVSALMFLAITLPGALTLCVYILLREGMAQSIATSAGSSALAYLLLSWIMYRFSVRAILAPVEKIWQGVWHVSPNRKNVAAPKIEKVGMGRELVSSLVMEIYNLASSGNALQAATSPETSSSTSQNILPPANELIESIPLPIFLLDGERRIAATNTAASTFLAMPKDKILGSFLVDCLRMSFSSDEDTFEHWLKSAETKATDTRSWEHLRTTLSDNKTIKQFDMAASYSKDKSSGHDVAITLFDKTAGYDKQDQATGYVAMAVHELRTPLTVLRGYIEVFEDELSDQLTPELKQFMLKMSASAQSLTAFVSNILNVSRIDENQFVMNLHEAEWKPVLSEIVKDLELRASVRGKTLELQIAEGLPSVAIDRISIYEVVSNLVDNAVKYSGQSTRIIITSDIGKDGSVETNIQDFGDGIPDNVISGLFTRYYRSHRSKNAISGSGLGLYLVKSIITAHGGNVWVNSKEGKGSTFGFSLQPFDSIKDKPAGSDDIERQASGWIKNHSMYRR